MCDQPLTAILPKNMSTVLGLRNPFQTGYKTVTSSGGQDSTKDSAAPVTADLKIYKVMVGFEGQLLELVRKLMSELKEDNLDEMIEAIRKVAVHVNARKQYYLDLYATNIELSVINLLRYLRTGFNEESVETTLTQINEFQEKRAGSGRFNTTMEFGSNIVSYTAVTQNGKYYINGTAQPLLKVNVGKTYVFDWYNDIEHPLYFSTTSDGIHNGGTPYETNVEIGLNTSKLTVTSDTPTTLYYYCINHPNMGGEINVVENDCGCGGAGTRSLGGRKKKPCNC